MKVFIVLEDCIIDATYTLLKNAGDPEVERRAWLVTYTDAKSGATHWCELSNEQLAAIVALGIGGEDFANGEITDGLHSVAEEAVKDWPRVCRPIP